MKDSEDVLRALTEKRDVGVDGRRGVEEGYDAMEGRSGGGGATDGGGGEEGEVARGVGGDLDGGCRRLRDG